MAVQGLNVPMDAPWYNAFKSELMSFPAGKHDDQVDALGLIGQLLDKIRGGNKPRPAEKPRDRWSRFLDSDDEQEETNWKTA